MKTEPPSPSLRATRRAPSPAARRALGFAALLGTALCASAAPAADAADDTVFRVGFTRSMFREVNENDARAALKAYTSAIAREHHLSAYPDPLVFEGSADMAEALRLGKVDIVAAPTAEMLALPDKLVTGPYMMTVNGNVLGADYVLLTPVDGGIATLADLRGRRVVVLNSLRGALANCWFEVLLGENGFGPPVPFLADLKFAAKPSLAILPVFFGQVEACVVTREGFAVASEMNPQVGRRLRILASSPLVVPLLTGFRRDLNPKLRTLALDTLNTFQQSVPGRQVLTLFQSERVEARDTVDLESTRLLLAAHVRLTASPPPAPPPLPDGAARPASPR